uniref:Predicted naringenin-chalcone synthase n=1 Tax=Candidatus Kentrum sp. UNK TaxID=2126344 RepID=A0A451AP41_9GAMM|nr:MAG: Predicted naringenin-chalcone synthase [Candidatus Kentron sp. UNK]VFK73117.1 MAG: Predicted naringenin-chalcone synthase [Candidatus Kentron sp. UNK]
MQLSVVLSDFTPLHLSREIPQKKLVDQIANVFSLVQCAIKQPQSQEDANRILAETRGMVEHYGVSPGYIKQRELGAMANVDISGSPNDIYPTVIPQPLQQPHGLPLDQRMEKFRDAGQVLLEAHYADCQQAPSDIVHVTCTGYVSPSPVQQFVAANGWHDTLVTHSYDMGCCGAFSGVRSAHGLLSSSFAIGQPKSRIDIFHTEYSSLHIDFHELLPHKIIGTTLFGDGFIHYCAYSQQSFDSETKNGLKILSIDDQMLPGSEQQVFWDVSQHHFDLFIAPTIPDFTTKYSKGFVERLATLAGYRLEDIKDDLIFAVHAGGPKILDQTEQVFQISREQLRYSWDVLNNRGNIVSATVPYIWHAVVNDDTVPKGTLVASMAFGPGLTACGMLMEKV